MNHDAHRSGCPINLALEILGDKWSLIIIRDMVFGNKRHFRELLTHSMEGIASNILAERLKRLVGEGILSKSDDPSHKQKALYSLTEKGIDLVPVLAQMAVWGRHHLAVSEELGVRAEVLEKGGPSLWRDLADELRALHLGKPLKKRRGPSVMARLQAAYESAVARKKAAAS
jgi:DNA-binding HxlR family transcriptional regulator